MKLTYYGTAAGEAWPGVFCDCELCRKARELGGKNMRTRSQALIDEELLLDLPPDNYMHTCVGGLNLHKVKYLFVTHSHSDHFYPEDLELLREPFSRTRKECLMVYGNEKVGEEIYKRLGTLGNEDVRFQYQKAEAFQEIIVGEYQVTPLHANHAKTEECLFYQIVKGDKAILYAHDTGWFPEDTMEFLKKQKRKFQLVSLDCTLQKDHDGYNHMGLEDAVNQKEILLREGLADENTVWVVNHFSHNGGWLHEELEQRARRNGCLASFDGMQIEVSE